MLAINITRHFATIHGVRQVHYRRAGHGPAVLLLHQSPASSAEMLPLLQELVPHYTVIIPDTPGNGLSTPLPISAPSINDFADGIVDFMDAIKLPRAAVYGFHTGAACAMSLSHRHADRIVVAIANGYTQMHPAELADILRNYLPPLTIEWNGSHLLWAWSRIRDQYIFFPWYARRPQSRLPSGMPRTAQLHEGVMDLLRAGNGYSQAYRAAFEYDRAAVVGELKAPTVIMTARTDALYRYLEMMPTPAASVVVSHPADYAEAKKILRQTLDQALDKHTHAPPIAAAAARPITHALWSDYLQTDYGSLFALRSVGGSGRPLVFCHSSAGSAMGLKKLMLPWVGTRPLLAVDLPGNGESSPVSTVTLTVDAQVNWLTAAISAAGYTDVDLLAVGGGAVVATALALRHPAMVNQITVQCMPQYFGTGIELDEHGLHLLRAWNMVRDQLLYQPWNQRKRPNVKVPSVQDLQPDYIHQLTVDLLKCRDSLVAIEAAHSSYNLDAALAKLNNKLIPLHELDQPQ